MRNPTPAQQAASRANGARSRGPVTPQGKRRSSQNSRRHGLLANTVVLDNESRAGFLKSFREHLQCIGPRDYIELDAVEQMCSASWRLRRLWMMERKALDLELEAHRSPDEPERLVRAFDSLACNRPHFLLLHRYETRLHNIIQRSLTRTLMRRRSGMPGEPGTSPPPTPALRFPLPRKRMGA